ncbi:MAG: dihydroorotase [Nitrospirae bacterium]|nr:dihydroorotase [Nitrospirota bacterium]
MSILIKNGRVIDPAQNIDGHYEILIEGKKIRGVYPKAKGPKTDKIIDASGCIVIPGLVDMHAHLRDPGFEYKESIRTGTMAAVRGGFTSVCCMPNTNPVNDNKTVTEFILRKNYAEGACFVYPIGAITKGQKGEELAEMGMMKEAGCIAFSDDGRPVMNSLIMRRALEYSKIFNVLIISHCEDLRLSEGGVINEGFISTTLGLRGIPKAAEEVMVARDIALAGLTGGRLHIAHVSTEGSVRLIRDAKERGISVTAETCPHYFCLTEDEVNNYNTSAKVNPPLRTERDVEAVKQGLKDNTIDVIATDHAPHHIDDKYNKEFDAASFGISGLETAFSLGLKLVEQGVLSLKQFIMKISVTPSGIIGIPKGTLAEGADADVAIIDLSKDFIVEPDRFLSKGKNTPFKGWQLKGAVLKTVSKGKVYEWE